MPQLSAPLIDEVRLHLTERWQCDAIYQRYANAPTEYEGPPSIRSFVADMLALPATALRDQRFEGTQKLLGRPPFCQLDKSQFGELLEATLDTNRFAMGHLQLPCHGGSKAARSVRPHGKLRRAA